MDVHAHRARHRGARRKGLTWRFATVATVAAASLAVGVAPQASAATQTIFEDGFESGNITAGGWTSTGALTVDGTSNSGDFAARIDDSGSLEKIIDTTGAENVGLSYARYTNGYDTGEELTVEWSTNGTNWNQVETYSSDGWATNQVQLGVGAADASQLRIRFRSDANGFLERFRIDDVVVTTTDGEPPPPPPDNCLPEVDDYTADGPFDFTTDSVGDVNMWIPEDLPTDCRVPIIHLANGTGARCSTYNSTLEHFASHGFVAACFEDADTGQGTQAIEAIETVIGEYPNIVDTRYGFTGHSQGGGGAILGVYRAEQEWGSSRTYAGFGIEPAHGFGDSPSNWADLYAQIESPVSMFNGSRDGLVSASWVRSGYEALSDSVEKAWYEGVGASHLSPIPNSYASEMGLAWFRWQLLGDSDACQYFKDMPNSSDWNLQETDNLSACS